jgi:hypothetical protein
MGADLFLPAITLWQPYASLVACGAKTWETRRQRTNYRGRIAIHASSVPRPDEPATVALPAIHDALWPHLGFTTRPMPADVSERLPRGAIVATAELTDCCPIGGPYSFRTGLVEGDGGDYPGQAVVVHHRSLGTLPSSLIVSEADTTVTEIRDQLPFGFWERGWWAWRLDDIKPTTERCPWCLSKGELPDGVDVGGVVVVAFDRRHVQCPVCDGHGWCDPVPARGMPGMWRWRP